MSYDDKDLLRVNDVLSRRDKQGRATAYYTVVGWSPRGKTILRNQASGVERAGWWARREDLPRGWKYEHPVD